MLIELEMVTVAGKMEKDVGERDRGLRCMSVMEVWGWPVMEWWWPLVEVASDVAAMHKTMKEEKRERRELWLE
ncbi:hypothetical protein P8452_14122 [Trifolium repens]|nr:hypothetical protein P8452_14122 [Trifolium repens]